jgi:hypothetical protein
LLSFVFVVAADYSRGAERGNPRETLLAIVEEALTWSGDYLVGERRSDPHATFTHMTLRDFLLASAE